MTQTAYDLVVIGAGPAGLTAALYAHRAGLKVLVIGEETPGGQVITHYRVDNYPGFPGGVTGGELMARWLKQLMDVSGSMPLTESVIAVHFSDRENRVFTPSGWYGCRSVIVATGSRPRSLNVPGEVELKGKGVFYCATCDTPLLRTMKNRRAAVVGGGDSAFHTALALLPHADSVTVITRGSEPKSRPVLVGRFRQHPGTTVLFQRSVTAIVGDKSVAGLTMQHVVTGESETLPAEAVFIGVGRGPVTEFLDGSLSLDKHRFIITDNLLRTSVAGVFAAGDVRATHLGQILTAAEDGAVAA